MANYNQYNDAPGKLKREAQQIDLNFTKTGPTTAMLCWNVPTPDSGCGEQGAYNGMLLVGNVTPNTTAEAPVDGTKYIGDPTASTNLHVGDKINGAFVMAALYDDTTTTCVNVTGLDPNTAYYFTGHAVDQQFQYHTGGVNAYSPSVVGGDGKEATPGYQVIQMGYTDNTDLLDIINHGTATGVQLSAPTCLDPAEDYTFQVRTTVCESDCTDCQVIDVTISGSSAQTYGDLINAINAEFANICNNTTLPEPPNKGCIYMDVDNCQLGIWNGSTYDYKDVICSPTNPNVINPNPGMYWFNPETEVLSMYNGTEFVPVDYISYFKDPTNLNNNDYWFDGSNGYAWEGAVWCERDTYVQLRDPTHVILPDSGTYWFNPTDGEIYVWNTKCDKWLPVDVIVSPIDPNNDTDGMLWFNVDEEKLYIRNGGMWEDYTSRVDVSEVAPEDPIAFMAWVDPENDLVYVRDVTNTTWTITPAIFYHYDPMNRSSCQLWWDTTADELMIWDTINMVWVPVSDFIQSVVDPALPPYVEPGALWYNPLLKTMVMWDGSEWVSIHVIYNSTDPTKPPVGEIWYNTLLNTFQTWNGTDWDRIDVFVSIFEPGNLPVGTFWYDTSTGLSLSMWNGIGWVGCVFQTEPCSPVVGFTYYNITDGIVYSWNGTSWIPQSPPIMLMMNCKGSMVVVTDLIGCKAYVEIIDGNLFNSLCDAIFVSEPVSGSDNVPGVQNYAVQGVGTDGSDDERKNLITELRHQLGAPAYTVELSREQFDTAIRLALEELRRRSASAYERGFFFLDTRAGVQKYELTNQCVGFNKITEVMAAYRMQSSFLGNATGQGAYGQAMLQHMYQMGSFDLVSYHIVSDYTELMNELFAAYLVFSWKETSRELHFHQTFGGNERILLDAMIERTEQDLMRDRFTKTWIERYALGKCQLMLAEIRGRYASLPGAGGGITLNSQELKISGEANLEWCEHEIENYIANEIETVGIGGDFILG